ncbi:MAG: Arylsulfatase, partial [Pseudomonadota bacterium]
MWGFSDVGAFGGEIQTPNLNQLANSGIRFSNFHVSASCSPTRSMLLTGVDNHLNGVGNMRETIPQSHVGRAGYLSVLNQRVVTVSSLLQDSGYRTYVAGKWHVGKEPHNLPPARGFDRSLVMGDSGSDNWETGKLYLDLTDKVYWYDNGQEAKMPKEFYSSEFYINKTLEYLQADAKSDKPFFAYIAFQANHIPIQAPQSFIDKYKGRYDRGWDV